MYSYEDRLRAVRLYIKLGKRVRLTIRQLGYPTKNALKTWYREYEQRQDLPAGYARQPMYSQAHKERAVEHYLEHGRCIAATVRSLGYPSKGLLSAWLQELLPQERARVGGRSEALAPEAKEAAVIALCMRPASAQAVLMAERDPGVHLMFKSMFFYVVIGEVAYWLGKIWFLRNGISQRV